MPAVPSLPLEAASVLALAALLLLPGLLVARAPWTAVPALSFAFWALTLWWLPPTAVARGRFVGSALAAFALLALLRVLPKHEVLPPGVRPPAGELSRSAKDEAETPLAVEAGPPAPRLVSGPSLAVVAVALALLAPFPLSDHAPGAQMAFQTTSARLLVWRDGLPLSGQPLLPLAPFGAYAPALPTLAADVSALSGVEPARAVLLVTLATVGLLLIGLFGLYATVAPPPNAALGALFGLALAPWPGFLAAWGEGGAIVGLSLGVSGTALLVGRVSLSSAVAAGLLLAASALGQPLLALLTAGAGAAAVLWVRSGRAGPGPRLQEGPGAAGRRLAVAFGVSLVLAAPYLGRLAHALSAREAMAALTSPAPGELRALALGLVLLATAPVLAGLIGRQRPRRPVSLAFGAVSAVLLVARVGGWIASGQLPARTRAAIARAGAATHAVDSVCAPEGARDWVPALAGRAAGDPGPWIPPVYRDEWAESARRPCAARLEAFVDRR